MQTQHKNLIICENHSENTEQFVYSWPAFVAQVA